MSDQVRLQYDEDGLLRVRLDRPQRANALDIAMLNALAKTLRSTAARSARALLFATPGRIFSAGGDLDDLKARRAEQHTALVAFAAAFELCPVPVICALNGRALGAGAIMPILADVTLMGPAARLEFPEMDFGLMPATMVEVLAERVPRGLAVQIGLGARRIGAAEALAMGLATELAGEAEADFDAWCTGRARYYADRAAGVLLARSARKTGSLRERVERSGIQISAQLP